MPAPAKPVEAPSLHAGTYRVNIIATRGSRSGAATRGTLTLVHASASDRSDCTGEVARDSYDYPPNFYGWTELDWHKLAAPICDDRLSPAPDSHNPVRPGVIVHHLFLDYPAVIIGSLASLRDGSLWMDGCGVVMFVERWDDDCFEGKWDRAGIVGNGSGTYRACPTVNDLPRQATATTTHPASATE